MLLTPLLFASDPKRRTATSRMLSVLVGTISTAIYGSTASADLKNTLLTSPQSAAAAECGACC
jgi:hypothetical protein